VINSARFGISASATMVSTRATPPTGDSGQRQVGRP
jgi:hypothetical protein